ncbi:MAG: cytochrome c [Gammaproteobacteria bacterium]|nr:cytochrome c [Gammaproteobacteria bacterium]MBU2676746.1 cytochrome c [Gammaproteobacteria bacterium]NNC57838.1 c-type cytochrome [Woeseiaceae bacterium]NNL50481.1 c-type cytochrome [Woeseiaceae bacterium]
MKASGFLIVAAYLVGGCASETPSKLLDDYEEVDTTTVLDAPSSKPGTFSPEHRDAVLRGEYLVELLGCGSCHTDGALVGAPDMDRALAGSRTGIAFTNPLGEKYPGVIYPANITPDNKTGIGEWTDSRIANAIRAGIGRHGSRRLASMPWQGYARISDDDVAAIVGYLRSIDAVEHDVPDEVEPGERATHPFVYFGVYRSK